MAEQYKIETFEDILNVVTDENIDNFMVDFKQAIKTSQAMRYGAEVLPEEIKDAVRESTSYFIWVDDGKNEVTVTIKTK